MTKTASSNAKKKVTRRKSTRIQKQKTNDKKKPSNECSSLAAVYFNDIRERTNDFEELIPELGNINIKDVTSNTPEYQVKQCNVLGDFLDYLNKSNMYRDKMNSVDFVCCLCCNWQA